MTSGSRQIRVACAKCGYDKQRTLVAGDDRTLEQLSASLRCGGCRTWGKSGAIRVSLAASHEPERTGQSAGETRAAQTTANGANRESGPAKQHRDADTRPVHVHGTCLNCGHNENFKPKWRRGETVNRWLGTSRVPSVAPRDLQGTSTCARALPVPTGGAAARFRGTLERAF